MAALRPWRRWIASATAAGAALLAGCATAPAPDAAADSRTRADFLAWQLDNAAPVRDFEHWLRAQKLDGLVPLHELLRTASMWRECKGPPFEVPPRAQWGEVQRVLQLVATLRAAQVLGDFTVHSAYRNPPLNECAGGARRSAHMVAFAIDITPPRGGEDPSPKLCEFWRTQGPQWRMGLGRYPSGRIHIDTFGHRTWGGDSTANTAFCRPAA